jgi:hypothetical protein
LEKEDSIQSADFIINEQVGLRVSPAQHQIQDADYRSRRWIRAHLQPHVRFVRSLKALAFMTTVVVARSVPGRHSIQSFNLSPFLLQQYSTFSSSIDQSIAQYAIPILQFTV